MLTFKSACPKTRDQFSVSPKYLCLDGDNPVTPWAMMLFKNSKLGSCCLPTMLTPFKTESSKHVINNLCHKKNKKVNSFLTFYVVVIATD